MRGCLESCTGRRPEIQGLASGADARLLTNFADTPTVPVSYTHLDVYKRQVYGLLGLSLALRLAATVWNNLEIRKVSFWKCPQIRHFSRFVQTIGLISPCRIGIMMTIILG